MLPHFLISHQVREPVIGEIGVTTRGIKVFYIQKASPFLGPMVRRDYGRVLVHYPDMDFVHGCNLLGVTVREYIKGVPVIPAVVPYIACKNGSAVQEFHDGFSSD